MVCGIERFKWRLFKRNVGLKRLISSPAVLCLIHSLPIAPIAILLPLCDAVNRVCHGTPDDKIIRHCGLVKSGTDQNEDTETWKIILENEGSEIHHILHQHQEEVDAQKHETPHEEYRENQQTTATV